MFLYWIKEVSTLLYFIDLLQTNAKIDFYTIKKQHIPYLFHLL